MDRIAERIKETRDRDFVEKKGDKATNNVPTISSLGGATMDNEENYLQRTQTALTKDGLRIRG